MFHLPLRKAIELFLHNFFQTVAETFPGDLAGPLRWDNCRFQGELRFGEIDAGTAITIQ
jgi:hypothetical protein